MSEPVGASKLVIDFYAAEAPIREPVSKFGGQPVWLDAPTWPLSPAGEPMVFVGQVRLDSAIFANHESTMVYLFVTDAVEALTFEAYGGDNAVIVQPGATPWVDTVRVAEGPALQHLADEDGVLIPAHPSDCEFAVSAVPGCDLEPVDEQQAQRWGGDPWREYVERAQGLVGTRRGNKIGGEPYFHRGWPEPFTPDEWRLVLQLDEPTPFFLNLSPDGTGYVLIDHDLTRGVFFWERPG